MAFVLPALRPPRPRPLRDEPRDPPLFSMLAAREPADRERDAAPDREPERVLPEFRPRVLVPPRPPVVAAPPVRRLPRLSWFIKLLSPPDLLDPEDRDPPRRPEDERPDDLPPD